MSEFELSKGHTSNVEAPSNCRTYHNSDHPSRIHGNGSRKTECRLRARAVQEAGNGRPPSIVDTPDVWRSMRRNKQVYASVCGRKGR